jgi:outer membrane protein assembly factor BamB
VRAARRRADHGLRHADDPRAQGPAHADPDHELCPRNLGLDAKTGELLWEAKVFDKRAVSSPVVVGDLVFGSCGSGGGGNFVAAVKLGGKGDVTSSHLAYTVKAPRRTCPPRWCRATGSSGSATTAWRAASKPRRAGSSGRSASRERTGGNYFGSPVLISGKIYFTSNLGEIAVVAAADEFKILSRNPLGEGSDSTPCVDGDRLYIKTFTHLVCVGGK